MNDSPAGCQSRLTEAASSRKKEPYRPHQAKPELVARLEVISKEMIFFLIPTTVPRQLFELSGAFLIESDTCVFPCQRKPHNGFCAVRRVL